MARPALDHVLPSFGVWVLPSFREVIYVTYVLLIFVMGVLLFYFKGVESIFLFLGLTVTCMWVCLGIHVAKSCGGGCRKSAV